MNQNTKRSKNIIKLAHYNIEQIQGYLAKAVAP